MIRRNILKTTLVIGMALVVVVLLILNGWIAPLGHNLTSQAAGLESARPNTAPHISFAAIPAAQGPSIVLEPFAGPATSAVTVKGNGWQAGDEMLISVQDEQGQLYKVANTVVGGEGDFSVSFFVPDFWKNNTTVTVTAQAVGGPQASAFYTVTDVPTPIAPAQPQEPQGVVITNTLNVRSGPGEIYPIVGRLLLNQAVTITGQNSGWWQIEFPNATGDFG